METSEIYKVRFVHIPVFVSCFVSSLSLSSCDAAADELCLLEKAADQIFIAPVCLSPTEDY